MAIPTCFSRLFNFGDHDSMVFFVFFLSDDGHDSIKIMIFTSCFIDDMFLFDFVSSSDRSLFCFYLFSIHTHGFIMVHVLLFLDSWSSSNCFLSMLGTRVQCETYTFKVKAIFIQICSLCCDSTSSKRDLLVQARSLSMYICVHKVDSQEEKLSIRRTLHFETENAIKSR